MVMLHIKSIGIRKFSNMVAIFFPADPPIPFYPRSQKVKIQLFRNMVMLDIKLTGIINAATWQQIFCPQNLSLTTLGAGSKGQNSTFSEHGHVAYQIIENHECSNMVANIWPKDPNPRPLGMGSIGQNSIFSGHCHVAYQIIENHECSIMVANILLADPPPPPTPPTLGMESICQNSTLRTWSCGISN